MMKTSLKKPKKALRLNQSGEPPDAVPDQPEVLNIPPKYKLHEPLGHGGMKTVYRATDLESSREIALAVMQENNDSSTRERFISEARITARLEHPNIIPIHEVGICSNPPYFTMKLVRGHDLATVIEGLDAGLPDFIEKYTLQVLLEIFLKVCDAVAFAHSNGIIHLDLKPENIQIGDFGEVLLLDWGLAKIHQEKDDFKPDSFSYDPFTAGHTPEMTMDGVVKGTPAFMAPEQAAGKNSKRGYRTDIYALGAILYAILTFRPPVGGKTPDENIANALKGNIIPIRQRIPPGRTIPPPLEFITYKALERDPKKRYASVAELKSDIHAYIEGYATEAEEAGFFMQVWLLLRRNKLQAQILGGAVAVIMFMLVSFIVALNYQKNAAVSTSSSIMETQDAMIEIEKKRARLEEKMKNESRREWHLRYEDSFSDNYVLERWKFSKGAKFKPYDIQPSDNIVERLKDGIKINADGMLGITSTEKIPADSQRVSFEMSVSDQLGNMTCVLNGTSPREGYYFILGGLQNTKAMIIKGAEQETIAERSFSLTPDTVYKVEAQLVREGAKSTLSLKVNGLELLSAVDAKASAPGMENPSLSFITSAPSTLHNVKVYILGAPMKMDILDIAARQMLKGNYTTAINLFEEVDESTTDPSRRARSADGIRLAKMLNEYKGKISEWERSLYLTWPDANIKIAVEKEGFMLELEGESISDISILSGLPVSTLKIRNSPVSDLSPISGMEITNLEVFNCNVTSLSPLRNMRLESLNCSFNPVESLEPLKGMPLKSLNVSNCGILSLEPLRGNKSLEVLDCAMNIITDISPLEGMSLTELSCAGNRIKDISPLRKMPLTALNLSENQISDVSPLAGLQLVRLNISSNAISSLAPLKGMSISSLNCSFNRISDLAPLAEMPLVELNADRNKLKAIDAIKSAGTLTTLSFSGNEVSSIEPLAGLKNLTVLSFSDNRVSDLTPLASVLSLKTLSVSKNKISSLVPLKDIFPLKELNCSSNPITELDPLDSLALDILKAQDLNVSSYGKMLGFPPRKTFIMDSASLDSGKIAALRKSLGDGQLQRRLSKSLTVLSAFKNKNLAEMRSFAVPYGTSSNILFIPSLVTYDEACKIAVELNASLPKPESRFDIDRLAGTIESGFWLGLSIKDHIIRQKYISDTCTDYFRCASEGTAYYLDDTGAVVPSESKELRNPLVLVWEN